MKIFAGSIGFLLMMTLGLFGADNVLTPQEKSAGWVLLFDGQSLNGWNSAVTAAPGRAGGQGGGTARGGAPKQAKSPAQPGAAPQVGSNPRTCSTPMGQAPVAAGASH